MNRYVYNRFAHVPERVSTTSFVVLMIGNSKSNHLEAQGTFKGLPEETRARAYRSGCIYIRGIDCSQHGSPARLCSLDVYIYVYIHIHIYSLIDLDIMHM